MHLLIVTVALITGAFVFEEKPKDEKFSAARDDDYRLLHDRYRTLILGAPRAGRKEDVAKLTDKFNETIGGKLLFAQVTLRVGPIAEHKGVFSKVFDPQRKISIGKLNFAVSAKPIVSQNHDGQDVVLIATNPLGGNKWPDDLQVTLVMDNVPKKNIKKALAVEPTHAAVKPALKASQWGEVLDGFRARLSAGKQSFDAAEPIPLRLEIENSGEIDKEYFVSVIPANQTVRVVDERGRNVLTLLNIFQVTIGASRPGNIKAGHSVEIASFDLGESFYLRRLGRYKASWSGEPASAEFEFEVAPNPARTAADGDPIGRLSPLVKESWWLGAGPRGKMKPGSNWDEATGQIVRFARNPPAHNGDGFIQLFLMDEPAAAIPMNSNSSAPATEYLGKISRWHVYYLASEIGLKTWPTAKEEIKQALAAVPKVSIQIDAERAELIAGESVAVPITIRNVGKQDSDDRLLTRFMAAVGWHGATGGIMLAKMRSVLRWAGAAAVGAALAIWLAAVAFALLGFRRTAEAGGRRTLQRVSRCSRIGGRLDRGSSS